MHERYAEYCVRLVVWKLLMDGSFLGTQQLACGRNTDRPLDTCPHIEHIWILWTHTISTHLSDGCFDSDGELEKLWKAIPAIIVQNR